MNEVPYPGDELRQQREALGLSAQAVFEQVRIPTVYIEALERGDFEALPAPGYTVGFLRTYCRFLNVAPERYVDSFRARAGFISHAPQTPRMKTPQVAVWKEDLLAWAAICAILLLGWITYTVIVHPKAEITDKRVEAGTREMVVPPSPIDPEF